MFRYAYDSTIESFINDCKNGEILNRIRQGFKKEYGVDVRNSEEGAWKGLINNICKALENLLSKLPKLNSMRIFIEFGMPFSSARADVFLLGKKKDRFAGIIIEHKQWSDSAIQIKDGILYVIGREELHPYQQAEAYTSYLKDYVQNLRNAIIKSVAYLPNLNNVNLLKKGTEIIFGRNSENDLSNFIRDTIDEGLSDEELQKFFNSRFVPSKTLVGEVVKAINQQKSWILLNEQKLVFERVKSTLNNLNNLDRKVVIIVKGGPGTGKSAIALQLLGYALKEGYSAVHITNSSAFTTTIKGIILNKLNFSRNKLNGLFKLSHNFIKAKKNSFDIAICDEAHRFRKSTNFRWLRSGESQIYQIIFASKLSVFFVDENQIVRPGEDGRIEHIKEQARRLNADVYEYELEVQFRYMGNENFVKWLDCILDLTNEFIDPKNWQEHFEFKIFERIEYMEKELQDKINKGYTGRIVAGFVWPWNNPHKDGALPLDIKINNWMKPWNKKRPPGKILNPQNDPYYEWATRKQNPLSEVGCIYSVQGFEFDYIGVIWGNDLVIRNNEWVAYPNNSQDPLICGKAPKDVLTLLKNTYRVLLSRGMRGCYVYFLDKETKEFFKKHFC